MGSADKEITEMRLFSPLTGSFYDSENYFKPLSGGALYGYEYEIREALEKDWIKQGEKGLGEFLRDPVLKERIVSMYPSVDVWQYSLWGVLEIKCRGALSPEELGVLKDEWHGQMTDGWGETFAQDAIDCGEDCRLYVDYGNAEKSGIWTEQELKSILEEQRIHTGSNELSLQTSGIMQTMGMELK